MSALDEIMASPRQRFCTYNDAEVEALAEQVRSALEGDSNDAEHDALYAVAEAFGLEIEGPS